MFVDFNAVFNRPTHPTATFEIDTKWNRQLLEALLGNSHKGESTLQYETVEYVPVRKHKKRRIQKKWLKRYGTKEVRQIKKFKGVPTCKKNGDVCDFEFRGRVDNG